MDSYGMVGAFLRGALKRFAQWRPLPLAGACPQAGWTQAIFNVHVAHSAYAVVRPIQDSVQQLHALAPVQTRAPVALTPAG